jgi:hypothetical protein
MATTLFSDTGSSPPFLFDGVTARIFPLRAHYHTLSYLCDTYLNRDSQIARFRPCAPYVFLSILNYGRMSSTSENAAHYGWVSQNEVFFAVPIVWEERINGRWVFRGWSCVCPFIFVDQPWSIEVGREVYGWPKEEAFFQREVSNWAARSPADSENLLTLETQTFATPYAGELPSPQPLLEIERSGPWDTGARLWKPPLDLHNPLWGPMTMTQEWLRWMANPGLRQTTLRMPQWLLASQRGNRGHGPLPPFFTINLKQVRDLENPELAAYQAVTAAAMRVNSINRVGMLGEPHLWRGDLTGGYRIKLHRHAVYPIAETLGLITSSEQRTSDTGGPLARGYTAGVAGNTRLERFPGRLSTPAASHDVATLAPIMPYWIDLDLEYGVGETIMYRGRGNHRWTRPGSRPRDHFRPDTPGDGTPDPILHPEPAEPDVAAGPTPPPRYDTTWDSRSVPTPPFYYPKVTARMLPLAADPVKLAAFIDAWGLPPEAGRLTPLGPGVFLAVMTSEEMSAESNSLGWWWQRQVAIFIPLEWAPGTRTPDAGLGPVVVLAAPLSFTDGQLATNTAREYGSFMIRGTITAPPDAWLDHDGPRAGRRLMWLSTEVMPAIGVDAEGVERVLVEVLESGGPPLPARPLPPFPAGVSPVPVLGLRQIRDAHDPDQAAFLEWFTQDMRAQPSGGHTWTGAGETRPLEVRIHHYPELDIVETLGLVVDSTEFAKSPLPGRGWEGTRVSVLRPLSPFWLDIDLTHAGNTVHAIKRHERPWRAEPVPLPRPDTESIDIPQLRDLLTAFFEQGRR